MNVGINDIIIIHTATGFSLIMLLVCKVVITFHITAAALFTVGKDIIIVTAVK